MKTKINHFSNEYLTLCSYTLPFAADDIARALLCTSRVASSGRGTHGLLRLSDGADATRPAHGIGVSFNVTRGVGIGTRIYHFIN